MIETTFRIVYPNRVWTVTTTLQDYHLLEAARLADVKAPYEIWEHDAFCCTRVYRSDDDREKKREVGSQVDVNAVRAKFSVVAVR